MFFTDGKLRSYEQLMRQSPRRSSDQEKAKNSTKPKRPSERARKTRKGKADGSH